MKLHKFRYVCRECKALSEAYTNALPNPDKTDWYNDFICGNCEHKRMNKEYWEKLSE